MSDIIIVNGDQLQFDPMFDNRLVKVAGPAIINGSGQASINQQKMCVLGDEKKVQIPAQYQIPGYSPGMGLLTIAALGSDQQAPRCASGAALLVKGQDFIARFTPTQPAINSTSSVPDTPSPSMGKGRFIPKQSFATAG